MTAAQATPKQALIAHLREYHLAIAHNARLDAKSGSGDLERRTLVQLWHLHSQSHHRFTPRNHIHWDGTPEDANTGATQRPKGWKTGGDVRVPTPGSIQWQPVAR